MVFEIADANGDGMTPEPLKIPDDAQTAYILRLEERLAAFEERLAKIETARPEPEDNSVVEAETAEEENSIPQVHPAFPPTVPEVRSVNFLQAFHHDITAPTIPAIEITWFSEKTADQDPKLDAFKKTLSETSPTKAMELINAQYDKPIELDMNVLFSQIRILSNPLGKVLWTIICGETLGSDQVAIFNRPFAASFYYHDDVKSKLAEMETEQEQEKESESDVDPEKSKLLEELKAYIKLMEETIMPHYANLQEKTATDNVKIFYDDLWHVFPPGEIIYYPDAKERPSKADYDKLQRSKRPDQKLWKVYTRFQNENKYWIKAYCIDHDGDSYVCVKEWFTIEKFDGKISANSLPVYPVRFANNGKKLMEDALEAGKGFLKTHEARLLGHNGWGSIADEEDTNLIYVSGDVVIDFAETFKAHPQWKPISMIPATYYLGNRGTEEIKESTAKWYWIEDQELKGFNPMSNSFSEGQLPRLTKQTYCLEKDKFLSFMIDNESKKYTPEGDDLYLLPNRLFGYSLQDRRFVSVNVNNLREIEENRDKFKNLVINPDHEGMLRALVESHFRRKDINETTAISTTNQDIVQNKGRGLVILLHGVPGVGKTSTAEMIASNFQRPLLPITCGDLGLEPAAVETSLKQMFRVAQLWDCILLLDEADVFLSERVSSDLSRNALVSG